MSAQNIWLWRYEIKLNEQKDWFEKRNWNLEERKKEGKKERKKGKEWTERMK